MPGLVAFGRRWGAGSDDLIVPALFLIIFNTIWVVICACAVPNISVEEAQDPEITTSVPEHLPNDLLYLRLLLSLSVLVLLLCVLCESAIAYKSTRGSIIDRSPRAAIHYLLYVRFGILLGQIALAVVAIVWLVVVYPNYFQWGATKILIGVIVWHFVVLLLVFLVGWCIYDRSGRQWLQLARYQDKLAQKPMSSYPGGKRLSDTRRRNWRKRHFQISYQNTWKRRMRLCMCCASREDGERRGFSLFNPLQNDSLAEIAKLFSDFFTDFDVVPTDIIAGLVLLRIKQKQSRKALIEKSDNDTYEFLSGAAITPRTEFFDLTRKDSLELAEELRYFMQYALAAYGWGFYLTENTQGKCCHLLAAVRCCACVREPTADYPVERDNCCLCQSRALDLTLPSNVQVTYASFHCGIGQTPFFVAVDKQKQAVVLCIRGTISLRDLMTDLCAAAEAIPFDEKFASSRQDWHAHSGMIKAALYVKRRLDNEKLLEEAFKLLPDGGRLLIVGHSLGGGTAALLGLMLRDRVEYRDLHCYVFSPPGGLLTWQAAQECSKFVTACVVGKDCVPRLSLSQMEMLRHELMALWKGNKDTKWKIMLHGLPCCRSSLQVKYEHDSLLSSHPKSVQSAPAVVLTSHGQRLYPPGRILHVVRTWPKDRHSGQKPLYTAIWTDGTGFEEILISPVMIHDHMPGGVIEGLDNLVSNCTSNQCEQGTQTPLVNGRETSEQMEKISLATTLESEAKFLTVSTPLIVAQHSVEDRSLDVSDFVERSQSNRELANPTPERSVRFVMGPSVSSEKVVRTLYEHERNPEVEQAWTDFYDQLSVATTPGTATPDAVSLLVQAPSIHGPDEIDLEGEQISPGGAFRAVATYSGQLVDTDAEAGAHQNLLSGDATDLGKARSENYLLIKDDTSPNALRRSNEQEDVRMVGVEAENKMCRTPEMEDLTGSDML